MQTQSNAYLRKAARMRQRPLLATLLTGLLLAFAGCDEAAQLDVAETDDPAFQRGREMLKSGKYEEAVIAFQKVVDTRDAAPESHLELGLLFHTHFREPVRAVYHYDRYLEQGPQGKEAKLVKGRKEAAIKALIATLPGEPYDGNSELDRLDLLEVIENQKNQLLAARTDVEKERKEVHRLRSALLEARRRAKREGMSIELASLDPMDESASAEEPEPEPEIPETYTVRPGDSLYQISMEVYGNSVRYMDIFRANQDQLRTPNDLKEGQVLRLP